MSKSRNYCFTFNNYDGLPDLDHEFVRYSIYQEEIGEEGTPHLQGYIELTKPMRITAIIELNNWALHGAYLASRRGTQKQAIDYCRKRDETYLDGPYEFGSPARQGERQDLKDFTNSIKAKSTMKELLEEHTTEFYKYFKMIPVVSAIYSEKPPVRPASDFIVPLIPIPSKKSIFIYGPTSIGKTEYARAHFKNPFLCTHLDELKNISTDNDGIIFDDLSFAHMPAEARIKILDRRLPSAIHLRYTYVTLDPAIPRIFVSNNPNIFYHDLDIPSQRAAIDERKEDHSLNLKLFR